jgi:mannose-6-phosphate isomerase-like protein (cupin superfamily)
VLGWVDDVRPVPPGGGPLPHRHDFEETFVVLAGEIEVTFRGETSTLRAHGAAPRTLTPR